MLLLITYDYKCNRLDWLDQYVSYYENMKQNHSQKEKKGYMLLIFPTSIL